MWEKIDKSKKGLVLKCKTKKVKEKKLKILNNNSKMKNRYFTLLVVVMVLTANKTLDHPLVLIETQNEFKIKMIL